MIIDIVIIYYSQKGHTKALVDSFARGASSVDNVGVTLVSVDEVDDNWPRLNGAHAIVFATPTFIGSVAAEFKKFVEKLTPTWLHRKWVGKLSAGITVSSGLSGDKLNCLMELVIFASQMGMIWLPMPVIGGRYKSTGGEHELNRMAGYLGVMAQANSDQDATLAPPPSDHRTAEIHGEYVALTARQVTLGRELSPNPDPLPWAREITIRGV